MGAPPSRTTPVGQPWGYPLLDPRLASRRLAGPNPPALAFVRLRFDKALREYDGLRIDHPHGWVCPWVYRDGTADPVAAVNAGTRLFESPDDPQLAAFAIARPAQLRLERTRYDDGWVRELDDAQVSAYSELTDEILAAADRAGRSRALLLWELLSTQPYPLERVLQRQGLGRFRVTQKVRLHDPQDAYRSELAGPQDWMMVGNHDTEPIWTVVRRWQAGGELGARAAYLASRLCGNEQRRAQVAAALSADPRLQAQAQIADLFASAGRQVLIFVSDLIGETRSYNLPGVVHPDNWTLRVPSDYPQVYAERVARAEAVDLPLVLALALVAQGEGFVSEHRDLFERLRASAHPAAVERFGL
jgi:4-alpha-glucanotransferase